jgi:hypothetical protein
MVCTCNASSISLAARVDKEKTEEKEVRLQPAQKKEFRNSTFTAECLLLTCYEIIARSK